MVTVLKTYKFPNNRLYRITKDDEIILPYVAHGNTNCKYAIESFLTPQEAPIFKEGQWAFLEATETEQDALETLCLIVRHPVTDISYLEQFETDKE